MYLLDGQQFMVHAAADTVRISVPTPSATSSAAPLAGSLRCLCHWGQNGNGTYYDISTKGREISRPPHWNLLFPAAVMASSIRGFPKTARDVELQAFACVPAATDLFAVLSLLPFQSLSRSVAWWHCRQRISPQSPGEGSVMLGGRHFWKSDYTTFHAESHFSSLKMFSTRMTNNGMSEVARCASLRAACCL